MTGTPGCTTYEQQAHVAGSPSLPLLLAGLGSMCAASLLHAFSRRPPVAL